jgi:hypothetical protein
VYKCQQQQHRQYHHQLRVIGMTTIIGVVGVTVVVVSLFVPRARRTLGAYRIPLETGLLIPSD